jgi:hypothetical protein
MQGSSAAGVITAVASVLAAASLVISALALFVPILRKTKAIEAKVESVEAKVDGVHVIVNQQRTDAQNYNLALIAALREANIAVPADQSLGASAILLPKPDLDSKL